MGKSRAKADPTPGWERDGELQALADTKHPDAVLEAADVGTVPSDWEDAGQDDGWWDGLQDGMKLGLLLAARRQSKVWRINLEDFEGEPATAFYVGTKGQVLIRLGGLRDRESAGRWARRAEPSGIRGQQSSGQARACFPGCRPTRSSCSGSECRPTPRGRSTRKSRAAVAVCWSG